MRLQQAAVHNVTQRLAHRVPQVRLAALKLLAQAPLAVHQVCGQLQLLRMNAAGKCAEG